ncbi:MAG TPA: histidine phosphatase family protein [Conexibacter sp.]|nr:histidine phosphatase family protein [Conexibacter sp.]
MTTPPELWLVRHGETEWSRAGRHTGRTDVPLTAQGELHAAALAPRLRTLSFALVLASPLARARRTAELAGYAGRVELDADLVELDYGAYEGRTTAEIHAERPGWDLWRDGCPGGETISAAAGRAERVLARVRDAGGPALLVGHGHFSRVLTACALGCAPELGRHLVLDPAAISHLGAERSTPAVRLWNDVGHLTRAGGA